MKIVVAYKWAANPQDAQVGADGSVDWERAKASFGEYDAVAAELGRRLADETGAELIGLSVGGPEVEAPLARKGALSRGLDRLVLVSGPGLAGAGSSATAVALAAAVERIGAVDLVLTGDSSTDVGARLVPALLAARLGRPVLTDVTQVEPAGAGLRVRRTVRAGSQTLAVALPAVLAVAPDAVVPRVPGMKDILAAGKKPVEVLDPAALDLRGPAAAHEVTTRRPDRPARAGRLIDASDPAEGARELVAALRAAGVL